MHPTVLDQHVALGVDREREEVAIAETLAELDSLSGDRRRRSEVPGRLLLEDARQEQIAALGALALGCDESLRAAEPACRGTDLAAGGEVQDDPGGAANRAKLRSVVEVP